MEEPEPEEPKRQHGLDGKAKIHRRPEGDVNDSSKQRELHKNDDGKAEQIDMLCTLRRLHMEL